MSSTVQSVPGGKTHWIKKKVAPSIKPRGRPRAEKPSLTTLDKETPKEPKTSNNNTNGTETQQADNIEKEKMTELDTETPQAAGETLDSVNDYEVSETSSLSAATGASDITSPIKTVAAVSSCDTITTTTSDTTIEVNTSTSTDLSAATASTPLVQDKRTRRRRVRTVSSSSQKSDQDDEQTDTGVKGGTGGKGSSKRRKVSHPDKNQFHEAPDPSTMTMQDLIYYNPSSNPMNSDTSRKKKNHKAPLPGHSASLAGDQSVTTPPANNDDEKDEEDGGRIVPQLKIGADGTIQIDEESMVVETTHKPFEGLSETVTEEEQHTTSTSFRQRSRIKKWTDDETNQFYKALSQVGTDFTMMTLLVPGRTRKELKNKFKKEEKRNPTRIAAALERLCSKAVTGTV